MHVDLEMDSAFDNFRSRICCLVCRPQRSTSQIVDAAQKVIDSANVSHPEVRRRAIPKRGRGSSPRLVACEDDRAEGMLQAPLATAVYIS
jgi:hypothetical protein